MNKVPLSPHVLPMVENLIQLDVSLKDKNWFKTGGPAQFFSEPSNQIEFQQVLHYANEHTLKVFILGQGANILISDEGFKGLVVRPALKEITIAHIDTTTVHVTAGAGITLDELIEYCLFHHILGLEEFSGIPGTIGGSVFINLHYYDFLLDHFLVSALIIDKDGRDIISVNKDWFEFGYNHSQLHSHKNYLLSATFCLKIGSSHEIAYARGRRNEIIRHRTKRYPFINTCGSFFRNFYDHEVNLVVNGKKMIYAAYYLDKIGVKGSLAVGTACVSYQHANMIVHDGNAQSADIIKLARTMQEKTYKIFNIILQPECQLIGFTTYPLLE